MTQEFSPEADADDVESPVTADVALPDVTALTAGDGDLTVEEAAHLTEMIRATADMMWVLLSRAHAGKAWKALGYGSFSEYVHTEFNISRSRAYQLLTQARVIEALESAAPEGTRVQISEAAARDVKGLVEDLAPQIAARTEGMTPDDAAAEIEAVVEEARALLGDGDPVPVPPVRELPEDWDAPPPGFRDDDAPWREPETGPVPGRDVPPVVDELPGASDGLTVTPVPSAGDDEDWDEDWDEEEDEPILPTPAPARKQDVLVDDDDEEEEISPALLRRRVQSAYDLYSTLMTMSEMPEPADVIAIIPVERRLLIDQSIDSVIDWLSQFRDEWNAQPWKQDDLDEDDLDDL